MKRNAIPQSMPKFRPKHMSLNEVAHVVLEVLLASDWNKSGKIKIQSMYLEAAIAVLAPWYSSLMV